MDAVDPLCVVSSTTCLLRRTLGGPAPAASPSKADEALLRGISRALKGSKELIEQSKIAMKEYGDIRMVYQDDGGKATAAANCKNQLGRRPAGERKRHRFTMKYHASKPLPVVDRSVLDMISDPDEYFTKEVQLDEAEAEIKRLNGEVQPKRTLNFEPVVERKRRNSSRPRKSYFFSSDAHAASSIITPVSQSENMAESQTSQDSTHASVSEKNEQSVPSRSDKCAISDSSVEEDSFNEKDKGDEITNIMASFQNYEGPDKLDYLRKTIGIGEIQMEKIYRRDSVLGDILPGSTAGINLQAVHTLEGPSSGTHQARVSELEKHIFRDAVMDKHKDLSKDDGFEGHTLERPSPGSHQARVSELAERIFRDAGMDKQTDLLRDDEFEGSPDIVMGEQLLAHDSSDVDLMTDETFFPREKDRMAPSPSAKSAEHVLDPEPNMPDCATTDDNSCSRHNISVEEDNMPMDYSTIDKSKNGSIISSHHLEDVSTEVLGNEPGRDVTPGDIARTPHSSENYIQHQEVVEEDGVVQDKLAHSSEVPLEDIGLRNRSQVPDGTSKEDNVPMEYSTIDKSNNEAIISSHHLDDVSTEVLGNEPGRDATPDDIARTPHSFENYIQHQEVVEEDGVVQDKSAHSSEVPLEDIGLRNRSQVPDGTSKKLTDDVRSALSLTKQKTRKAAQQGKTKQQPKRGEEVADESHHSREIPQADFDAEDQPHAHDVNTERLIPDRRNALSSIKEKKQKPSQRGKNKQQLKRGKKVSAESRHLLEIPQADLDPENRPHTHDVNTEQQTVVMRNALSPNKPKGQKEGQRRIRDRELNKRKSLADAGLQWQSGVRRSTRIRHRPLEQWRGEKFVYGRIHDTLVTVIGVKSYSPDQDGKIALKVKSFVPEQYSDVVTQGAKY